MRTVSLNSIDRVNLSMFVEQKPKGNRIEMALIYDIMRKADFTPAEIEAYGIEYDGKGVVVKRDFSAEIEFSDQQIEMIIGLIDMLHQAGEIHIQMVPTINKFDNL